MQQLRPFPFHVIYIQIKEYQLISYNIRRHVLGLFVSRRKEKEENDVESVDS